MIKKEVMHKGRSLTLRCSIQTFRFKGLVLSEKEKYVLSESKVLGHTFVSETKGKMKYLNTPACKGWGCPDICHLES